MRGKKYLLDLFIITIIATLSLGLSSCSLNNEVLGKENISEEKSKDKTVEILEEKNKDITNDGIMDKITIEKGESGQRYLMVYKNGIKEDFKICKVNSSKVLSMEEVNGDGIKDFVLGDKSDNSNLEVILSNEEGFIIKRLEEEKIKIDYEIGFNLNYIDMKSFKGVCVKLEKNVQQNLINDGYFEKDGFVKNSSFKGGEKVVEGYFKDIDKDGEVEYVISSKLMIKESIKASNIYKIYKFNRESKEFFLCSVSNKESFEREVVKKDLTIEEIKERIHKKTGTNKEITDYKLVEGEEGTSKDITKDFYAFYEIFNEEGEFMQSDSLIVVNKKDYSICRYYVDGIIHPL